jgi:hypothetical protein
LDRKISWKRSVGTWHIFSDDFAKTASTFLDVSDDNNADSMSVKPIAGDVLKVEIGQILNPDDATQCSKRSGRRRQLDDSP